jgi:hypothetical protein
MRARVAAMEKEFSDAYAKIFGVDPMMVSPAVRDENWRAWRAEKAPVLQTCCDRLEAWAHAGVGTPLEADYELQVRQHMVRLIDSSLVAMELDISRLPYFMAPVSTVSDLTLDLGARAYLPTMLPRTQPCPGVTTLTILAPQITDTTRLCAMLDRQFPNVKTLFLDCKKLADDLHLNPEAVEPFVIEGSDKSDPIRVFIVDSSHPKPIRAQPPLDPGAEPPNEADAVFALINRWDQQHPGRKLLIEPLLQWTERGYESGAMGEHVAAAKALMHYLLKPADHQAKSLTLRLAQAATAPPIWPGTQKLKLQLGARSTPPVFPVCEGVTQLIVEEASGMDAPTLSALLAKFPNLTALSIKGFTGSGTLTLLQKQLLILNVPGCENLARLRLPMAPMDGELVQSLLKLPTTCGLFLSPYMSKEASDVISKAIAHPDYNGPAQVRWLDEKQAERLVAQPFAEPEAAGAAAPVAAEKAPPPKPLVLSNLLGGDLKKSHLNAWKAGGKSKLETANIASLLEWASQNRESPAHTEMARALALAIMTRAQTLRLTASAGIANIPFIFSPKVKRLTLALQGRADLPVLFGVSNKVNELELEGATGLDDAEQLSTWLMHFPHLRKLSIQGGGNLRGQLTLMGNPEGYDLSDHDGHQLSGVCFVTPRNLRVDIPFAGHGKDARHDLLHAFTHPGRELLVVACCDPASSLSIPAHVSHVVLGMGPRADLPQVHGGTQVTSLHMEDATGLCSAEALTAWLAQFPNLLDLSVQGASGLKGALRLPGSLRSVDVTGCSALGEFDAQRLLPPKKELARCVMQLPRDCIVRFAKFDLERERGVFRALYGAMLANDYVGPKVVWVGDCKIEEIAIDAKDPQAVAEAQSQAVSEAHQPKRSLLRWMNKPVAALTNSAQMSRWGASTSHAADGEIAQQMRLFETR